MKVLITLSLLLGALSFSNSQAPVGKLLVPEVEESDFYKIELPTKVSGYFRDDYGNLRISDGSKYEVPYITGQSIETAHTRFRPYEILEKEQRRGCCTRLVFRAEETIGNIHLRIRNAEARKKASLLGSDDMENWFILKEKIALDYVDGAGSTSEIRIIDFPLSNYHYYRIDIDDTLSAPLNILEVGSYEKTAERKMFTPVPDGSVRVEEVDRKTRILVDWDASQRIDRLVLAASGQPVFRRAAELYSGHADRKRQWLASFELTNDGPAIIDVAAPLTKSLELVIHNMDSPPLEIDSVGVFQIKHFLVAYLRAGRTYEIEVYDKGMKPPVYDLAAFRERITGNMQVIRPEDKLINEQSDSANRFFSPGLMWAAIILIIAILGFYSYRMVRESQTG